MVKMPVWFKGLGLGVTLMFSAPYLFAEEYPFAGTVVGEDVNVRAGANLNYEIIGKLEDKESIIVLAKAYEWYKVRLKDNAVAFINKPLLRKLNDADAEVIGSDVNVRARPNTNATILGKLTKGMKVKVVREVPDWYQVVPPQPPAGSAERSGASPSGTQQQLSGYIFASYIQYKSSYADYMKDQTRKVAFEKRLSEVRALVEAEFKKERAGRSFAGSIKALEDLRRDYPEYASRRGILQEMDRLRIKQLELDNELIRAELAQTKAKVGAQ